MIVLRRLVVISLSMLALLGSGSANAIFRAYLSATGSDANPCTLPAPCRLMPAALAAVDAGGEIWMLNSGNFNTATVVIDKSVTIVAVPGALGSIVGNLGDAIQIATAGVDVTLQNLNIVKLAGDGDGIKISEGARVTVKGCSIFGFTTTGFAGIRANSTANTVVAIIDSTVRGNFDGVVVTNNAKVVASRSQFLANAGSGIYVVGTDGNSAAASVSDSVLSGNSYGGAAQGSTTGIAQLSVARSVASDNGFGGLFASGTATSVVTADSVVASGNALGLGQAGTAVFNTRGNNSVTGNTANAIGSLTPLGGL